MKRRTDFRPWTSLTIDPKTARDHDDAISIDRLPNGNYLLAVHIADVAHYVREGSALDACAYERGNSVYFPGFVVPMLPHALSSRICSLVEGEDRLTHTAVMEVDSEGTVVRSEFHDGVIRSAAKIAYPEAQAILDGDAATRERFAHVVPVVERCAELARILNAARVRRGSLDFDLPEPVLELDASGRVESIAATDRLFAMRMIEEFMLIANESVARALDTKRLATLYRIHEAPDRERVLEFLDTVKGLGAGSIPNLEKIEPADFQRILRGVAGKPEERLVSTLLLRTQRLARYDPQNLGHFGLATANYLHFTSPIRRYPDLVAHRALRALRAGASAAATHWPLDEMADHLGETERRAADAERDLMEWKKARFMASRVGETFDGVVTGVQPFGLFVQLDDVFVEGLVHVSTMADDFYVFRDTDHALRGENSRRAYRLGQRVEAQLIRVDLDRRQIHLALSEILGRLSRDGARSSASTPSRKDGHRTTASPPPRPTKGAARAKRAPGKPAGPEARRSGRNRSR
jgi:ribonuclease R